MQMVLVVHIVYVYVCRNVITARELERGDHYRMSNSLSWPSECRA